MKRDVSPLLRVLTRKGEKAGRTINSSGLDCRHMIPSTTGMTDWRLFAVADDAKDYSSTSTFVQRVQECYDLNRFCILPNLLDDRLIKCMQSECTALTAHLLQDNSLYNTGFVVEAIEVGSLPENDIVRTNQNSFIEQRLSALLKAAGAATTGVIAADDGQDMTTCNRLVTEFLFRGVLSKVCSALLQESRSAKRRNQSNKSEKCCFLFNEQYINKPGKSMNTEFAWHRDYDEQLEMILCMTGAEEIKDKDCAEDDETPPQESCENKEGELSDADCPNRSRKRARQETDISFSAHSSSCPSASFPDYVSLWIALDDMHEENGPLIIQREQDMNVVCAVPQGSVVLFSAQVLHCSSANASAVDRRAYYVQYTPSPLCTPTRSVPTENGRAELSARSIPSPPTSAASISSPICLAIPID